MNEKLKNRNLCAKRSRRAAVCLLLLGGTTIFSGCEVLFPIMGGPTISDGELKGINGWDVQASINVEPNQGQEGTAVAITIDFSRGGANVSSIEIEDNGGSNCWLARTWRNIIDKVSDTRWEMPLGRLYLTGANATSRFIALNSAGTRVAIGDVFVNGGCGSNSTARVMLADEETPAIGAFFDKLP